MPATEVRLYQERDGTVPVLEWLKELQRKSIEAATGQSREDSQKALAAAKTGAAARADGSVHLPGGTSAKDDVGDDIGALMRKGLADSLDMEE